MKPEWERYEQVAEHLLAQFSEVFGLGRVEGKQIVRGQATDWEIDAKAVKFGGEAFLVVECKRYTNSRMSQGPMGALAYAIKDVGAAGGIVVTPLGLQAGARKIAEKDGVHSVILTPESTTTDYIMKFLNRVFIGASVRSGVVLGDTATAEVVPPEREDGYDGLG